MRSVAERLKLAGPTAHRSDLYPRLIRGAIFGTSYVGTVAEFPPSYGVLALTLIRNHPECEYMHSELERVL